NVSSAAAWVGIEHSSGHGASKAAVWSMTNGLRIELTQQKTQLTGLHMASTDTEMTATLNVPKNSSQAFTRAALDGIEAGELGIFADEDASAVNEALSV